jgi:hypothetical protein
MRIEAFDSLDCVGIDKLFKSYKHMQESIINNYDLIKKQKITLQEAADKTPVANWTKQEIITNQKEIMGVYDKSLIFSRKVLDLIADYNILPLNDLWEQPNYHWFIVKDFTEKQTKTGKKYISLKISDFDDKVRTMNYFGKPVQITKDCIYIAKLFIKDGWINVALGSTLIQAS